MGTSYGDCDIWVPHGMAKDVAQALVIAGACSCGEFSICFDDSVEAKSSATTKKKNVIRFSNNTPEQNNGSNI